MDEPVVPRARPDPAGNAEHAAGAQPVPQGLRWPRGVFQPGPPAQRAFAACFWREVRGGQQRQWQEAQGGLQEALLPSAAEAAEAGGHGVAVPSTAPPYRLWCSKYFWSGVALLVLSAILCTLTIITTAHPGPFSPT